MPKRSLTDTLTRRGRRAPRRRTPPVARRPETPALRRAPDALPRIRWY
jgi:hypothetical protein